MVLTGYQKTSIEELLADGVRTGEYSMGRGGGKSTFMSALGLSDLFLGHWQPQVPIIATKVQQAVKACYSVATSMVKMNPELHARSNIYTAVGDRRIATEYNGGEMFPFAADVDGLQGLDPTMALVDEMGFISVASWEALKLAGGKRSESLVAGLGTTGKKSSALYHLEQLHRQAVVIPDHVRINFAATEGCDLNDLTEWHRANPAIEAGLLPVRILEADVTSTPEDTFRAFRLNQWVELIGTGSWLGPDGLATWNALADPGYRLDAGRPVFAGVDVSLHYDTTAVVHVQQRDDGRWHAAARIFHPEGGRIDQAAVRAEIAGLPNLASCAYDPRFFESSAQDLEQQGITMIEVPQQPQRMVPIIGTMYQAIIGGDLTHDGDPQFAAQVCQAVRRESEYGFTLYKNRDELKIDAAIALGLALHAADATPEPITDDAFVIH